METILKNIKENGTNIEVFEDNGGGLTLAVWHEGKFFCSSGFEYQVGSLVEILKDLQEHFPDEKEITEDEYYNMSLSTFSGHIILNLEDGFVNVGRMGAAGRKEFAEFLPEEMR